MNVMRRESFVIVEVRVGSTFISICSALFWEGRFLTEVEEGKREGGREGGGRQLERFLWKQLWIDCRWLDFFQLWDWR